MDEIECVVVGAGVIGLATARALAVARLDVLVLERAYTIGFETSSRNRAGCTIRPAASRPTAASLGASAFTPIAAITGSLMPKLAS